MDEADSVVPTRSAGVFVQSASGADGPAALLGRHPARRDGLGRGALAAKCWEYEAMVLREQPRRDPAARQRRDDRRAGARDARAASSPRRPWTLRRPSRAGTPYSSRQRCCSAGCATPPPARSASGSRARCTTASPRTSPRSATWSTTWRPPPRDPAQQEQDRRSCASEVTRVVTELRHSIFDLRHEIAAEVRTRARASRRTPTRSAPPRR